MIVTGPADNGQAAGEHQNHHHAINREAPGGGPPSRKEDQWRKHVKLHLTGQAPQVAGKVFMGSKIEARIVVPVVKK